MTSIHAGVQLLPSNRSAWEVAMSRTSAEFRDIDAGIIQRAFDPWACPAIMLPWLAHTLSVDYWREDWSENKKRRVIAAAIKLQWTKGTEEGLRSYIDLAEAKVRSITVPPQKVFSGPSMSVEEREEWLSGLPQIRVWQIAERGQAQFRVFSGVRNRPQFMKGRFLQPSDAAIRARRRARYIIDGVEQDARVTEIAEGFRIFLKGKEGNRVFCDRPIGKRYFQPSGGKQRVLTVAPNQTAPWRSAVVPSLSPVNVKPQQIIVRGKREFRAFCGAPMGIGFYRPSTAYLRIYDRYAIFDGQISSRRHPAQFMGTGRFGFPAHVAMVDISVPHRRSLFAAGQGILVPKSRFWIPHDGSKLRDVRNAINASKRVSDRIMLKLGSHERFVAGQPFFAGIDILIVGQPAS